MQQDATRYNKKQLDTTRYNKIQQYTTRYNTKHQDTTRYSKIQPEKNEQQLDTTNNKIH